MDDSIARICEEVDRDATVVFLVQLFGMHEIIESYENGSILVSQMFRDMVYDLESTKKISCYFVFQDLRFIVGFGDIVLEAEKDPAAQEPFEIAVKWSKLSTLNYESLDSVRAVIEDEEDLNWEIKRLDAAQVSVLREAMSACDEESTESIRAKYEQLADPYDNEEAVDHNEAKDTQAQVTEEQPPAVETTSVQDVRQEGNQDKPEPVIDADRKRSRSQERHHPVTNTGAPQGENGAPKRSRIPFDVTKMSYDQYCAKHYSYAIDMYRQEKLLQYQQQQQRAAMMPMGMPPMHMMGQHMGMNPNMGMGPGMGMNMGLGPGMGMYPGGPMPHMGMMGGAMGASNMGMGMPGMHGAAGGAVGAGYYPGQPAAGQAAGGMAQP